MTLKTRILKDKEDLVAIGAKIGKELHFALKTYAKKHDVSQALVIQEALVKYLTGSEDKSK